MRNAKVRFAIDDDGSVFDYVTSQNHPPHGELPVAGGFWDLAKVAELIAADLPIESAFKASTIEFTQHIPVDPMEIDKVKQANSDFLSAPVDDGIALNSAAHPDTTDQLATDLEPEISSESLETIEIDLPDPVAPLEADEDEIEAIDPPTE